MGLAALILILVAIIVAICLLPALLPILIPVGILMLILRATGVLPDRRASRRGRRRNHRRHSRRKNVNYNGDEYVTENVALTKVASARKAIIKRFCKDYDIDITKEDINKIVDASYISSAWAMEISDMIPEYEPMIEWYNSRTNWLKVYLKVVPVKSFTTDFGMQTKIVKDAFTKMFTELDASSYGTIDAYITAINNRYMTAFDDVTFTIAYRFLQSNGVNVKIPGGDIVVNESDVEKLARAYDSDVTSGTTFSQDEINKLAKKYQGTRI